MRIIGPPSAQRSTVEAAVAKMAPHARFISDILPALWAAGSSLTVDPVGMVAQSFKETAGGNFGGAIDERWCNPCGLKVRYPGKVTGVDDGDRPLAHQQFPSWAVGALAHAQHLRAYAGWPVPDAWPSTPIVDPRYDLVAGQRLENFEELGGRWAPSTTYGTELVAIARKLQAG